MIRAQNRPAHRPARQHQPLGPARLDNPLTIRHGRNVQAPENSSANDTPTTQETFHLPSQTGSKERQIGTRHKDNNQAERTIRGPVITRENACGSRHDDSARLAAVIWTVTATAQMAGLNLLTWLTAYLDACGRDHGKPLSGPDLARFLPWNASPEDLKAWAQPPQQPG